MCLKFQQTTTLKIREEESQIDIRTLLKLLARASHFPKS